ncbi:flagellar basal body-associated FliL family protein [Marinobacteraceae bacterium S3BR75-40.1]
MGHTTMRYILALTMLLALGGPAWGSSEGESGANETGTQYVELKPAFVVNVGEPGARLRYAKVSVTLRVEGKEAADKVDTHRPWIRNELVFLLSGQSIDQVTSSQGQQGLQQEALQRINAVLEAEAGEALVTDVLFTEFVVQR